MSLFENQCVGTEAGGAGHHLFHPAHVTVLDDIAEAVVRFAVIPPLSHIDLAPLLVWRGDCHLLGAGVHQNPGLPWNHNLLEKQAEMDQSRHPEAQMERKASSHMVMVLPTRAKGEICRREDLGILNPLISWSLQFLNSSALLAIYNS